MSPGLFTVHGSTFRPSAWASLTFSAVTLRQNGDQTAQPACLARRGTEPPWAARSRPPSQGDGCPLARPTVSMPLLSIERQPVAISGARRRASISPRQSNDWIVLRPPALPSRIASTASCAKRVGIDREVRLGRVGLDLDVEAHIRTRRGEKLRQRGEAFAVDRLLLGKLLRIFACGIEPADVVALELGQAERTDRRAGCADPFAVGPAHQVGIEHRVVADDQDIVLGDGEIGLERGDAEIEGGAEGRQRVLRRQPARAAMALQVEGGGGDEASCPDCAGERYGRQCRDAWPAAPTICW